MPFHFPLQTLLHFRRSLEHQQELRLRAANQQVARIQHAIDQNNSRQHGLQTEYARYLAAGISAAELHFASHCEAELLRQERELEQQRLRMQQLRDQQREVFQQARRVRETLEAVRDRQLREYQQSRTRREQRTLDDLFLLCRERSQRS